MVILEKLLQTFYYAEMFYRIGVYVTLHARKILKRFEISVANYRYSVTYGHDCMYLDELFKAMKKRQERMFLCQLCGVHSDIVEYQEFDNQSHISHKKGNIKRVSEFVH